MERRKLKGSLSYNNFYKNAAIAQTCLECCDLLVLPRLLKLLSLVRSLARLHMYRCVCNGIQTD